MTAIILLPTSVSSLQHLRLSLSLSFRPAAPPTSMLVHRFKAIIPDRTPATFLQGLTRLNTANPNRLTSNPNSRGSININRHNRISQLHKLHTNSPAKAATIPKTLILASLVNFQTRILVPHSASQVHMAVNLHRARDSIQIVSNLLRNRTETKQTTVPTSSHNQALRLQQADSPCPQLLRNRPKRM